MPSLFPLILSFFSILAIDQFSKFFAQHLFQTSLEIIPSVFKLTFQTNPYLSWGIPLSGPLAIFLILVLIAIGLKISWQILDLKKISTQILLGIILGGAVGNLLDRVFRGAIIDFISISLFPVFNFADIAISLGILFLFIFYPRLKI